MSPSESDLRAALRAGEPEGGDAVNADHIIWTVNGMRARRRNVALSVAAAVVVVGGIAGGVAAIGGSGPSGSSASGGGADYSVNGPNAAAPQRSAAGGSAPASAFGGATTGGTRSTVVRCSPKPEQVALPGGGSPGQFGASSPLLPKPVSSFVVCVYTINLRSGSSPVKPSRPDSIDVTGEAATQLAASLRNAATTPQSVACPLIRTTRQVTIVMTPIATDGRALKPVTAATSVPACNTQVTNGTAVRYNWQVPSRLQQVLGLNVVGSRYDQDPIDLVPGSVVKSIGTVGATPAK